MVSLREAKIPRGVRENIKGVKDLKSNNFFKLPETVQVDILNDGIAKFRTYIETRKLTPELSDYMKLFEDIYRETGDPNVTPYLQLFDAMKNRNGSKLSRDVFETLRNDDPDTFAVYSRYPGEEVANIPGFNFHEYKRTGNGVIEPAEPTTGALTSNPINNASSAETPSGALTNPPVKLPEADEQPVPSRVQGRDDKGNIIEFEVGPKKLSYQSWDDAELNEILARGSKKGETNEKLPEATSEEVAGTELNSAPASSELPKKVTVISNKPISDEEMLKLAYPKEGVVVGPETSKPGIDTPLAEGNSGAASSPEVKAAEKTEAATGEANPKATPEIQEGALTGKDEKLTEPSKGMFKKIGNWMRNHPKTSWGIGIPTVLGLVGGIGITQADKIAKALKAGEDLDRNAGEESESPEVFDNVNYRVWENYTPDYLNEEYVPGRIPRHIPQDNLDDKESPDITENKNQSQVVNAPAPVNNATADYVRAAYNSYIPSDAGRAYQKAIYGDPLELDRMRLRQQQQKWRDFVMRSGQSPAELVQRGLMPYDALQYV